MTRLEEADQFLKAIASTPNFEATSKAIYYNLTVYKVPKEERNTSTKENFGDWQNYFSNSMGTVYWDERQPRFLQFVNSPSLNDYNCVKMYFSFPKDRLNTNVKLLFDFIFKNNIPTFSKVADEVRSDGVVLRIVNLEDVKKIMDFVYQTPELYTSMRKTNPFEMDYNNIGLACDNLLSYNSILSLMISKYIKNKKTKNELDQVSVEDFKAYIEMILNNLGVSQINEFLQEPELASLANRFPSTGGIVNNFHQILSLIAISLDDKKNLDDYFAHVQSCQDIEKRDANIQALDNLLSTQKSDPKQLLDAYINYAKTKYGMGNISIYLEDYVRGNDYAITRDNGYRDAFLNQLPPSLIQSITAGNIQEYINRLLNVEEKVEETKEEHQFLSPKELLDSYIVHAIVKYGLEQVSIYLASYLRGNLQAITRDCGFRTSFDQKINPPIVNELTGGDLKAYISLVAETIKQSPSNREENPVDRKKLLNDYILLAKDKYGENRVGEFLMSYVNGNIKAITRDHDFRHLFVTYLSAEEILAITENDIYGYVDKVIFTPGDSLPR